MRHHPPRFLPESHLVLGTDFSEGATAAMAEARRLEQWMCSPVKVVHVIPHSEEYWHGDDLAGAWLRANQLEERDIVVLHGNPAISLVRYATTLDALALIVGSHGSTGYQCLRLGHTAARVATIADRPVLIVNRRLEQSSSPMVRRFTPAIGGTHSNPPDALSPLNHD